MRFSVKGVTPQTGKKLRYYGAEVARYLGMTTSAVNRSANSKELPEIKDYL